MTTTPIAYAYDAALHCEDCANEAGMLEEGKTDTEGNPVNPVFNSDTDVPEHCGDCDTFLENALTDEGVRYVIKQLQDYDPENSNPVCLRQWAEFYADEIEEEADIFFQSNMLLGAGEVEEGLRQDLLDCASPGQDAMPACKYVMENYCVVAHPDIAGHLISYGDWDWDELKDHEENVTRLVWLMGGAFREGEDFCLDDFSAPPESPATKPQASDLGLGPEPA